MGGAISVKKNWFSFKIISRKRLTTISSKNQKISTFFNKILKLKIINDRLLRKKY